MIGVGVPSTWAGSGLIENDQESALTADKMSDPSLARLHTIDVSKSDAGALRRALVVVHAVGLIVAREMRPERRHYRVKARHGIRDCGIRESRL